MMGNLGRYRAERADWAEKMKNSQKLITGRTRLPTENGPKSGSLQNKTF
jgi:hypothetical protein